MRNSRFRGFGCAGAAWAVAVAAAAGAFGDPILEYRFDADGTSTPGTGSATNPLAFFSAANLPTNLHGAAGSGVSGAGTDRCLDLSSAIGMGSAPGTADLSARHAADADAIDGLLSFTLSGWFRTSVPDGLIGGNAVLIDNAPNSSVTNGFRLSCSGQNLTLEVDSGTASTTGNLYDDKNRWVFFAVTYDGTLSAGNVRFYRGYRTASEARQRPVLSCVATATIDRAAVENDLIPLYVGNRTTRVRPFKGYLDNIRVHGSKTDASGALSAALLEEARSNDVAGLPDSRLVMEYTFNETGTNAFNTGIYRHPLLTDGTNGVSADFHGPPGSGVSEKGDDRALDFTSATGWGNSGRGPIGRHLADADEYDNLTSFTLSGWFKTLPDSPIDRYAKLISGYASPAGYELIAQAGALILTLDGAQVQAAYPETGKWVFFAVTYDGGLSTNNVRFYKGFRSRAEAGGSAAAACIGIATVDKGATDNNTTPVTAGNSGAYDRPFKGWLDNLRLHAGYRDSAGALDAVQVEALRAGIYKVPGTVVAVR